MNDNKITKEQLSEQDVALDIKISKQLQAELSQIHMSEDLFQRTLSRIEASKALAVAEENSHEEPVKKPTRFRIPRAWYGMAAAASVALIAIAVAVSGNGRKKSYSGDNYFAMEKTESESMDFTAMPAPDFNTSQKDSYPSGPSLFQGENSKEAMDAMPEIEDSKVEKPFVDEWPAENESWSEIKDDSISNEAPRDIVGNGFLGGVNMGAPNYDSSSPTNESDWNYSESVTNSALEEAGEASEEDEELTMLVKLAQEGEWLDITLSMVDIDSVNYCTFVHPDGTLLCIMTDEKELQIFQECGEGVWFNTTGEPELVKWFRIKNGQE